MKFHHLTRHNNQFESVQHQHQPHTHSHQDRSSMRTQQQQQQLKHLRPATSQVQSQQPQDVYSDDEDEFNAYDNEMNLQSTIQMSQNYHQQQHHHAQQQASLLGNNNSASLDTSGFLMDKNKKLFPQKLWELIHNPSIQHCLRWSQDGQRVYLNRNEFEAYYLKTPNNQFHTQKAISFVRQMNMYGFRKVDDCYYENDNFRRDQQHLLRNMIRRHPNKGLFVGLDHHQLAVAAAAQQDLQVNQQLHFESQHHKHRAEQALRLNSYLNNHHHQFHPSLLSHAAQQLSNHSHSSQFNHISSQSAQAAANHLSQHHHQNPTVSAQIAQKLAGVNGDQHVATDLSSQSLAARQALQQTLVRSLLQLKQHKPQDFLANIQHQNSRTLLASFASLSSGGTGLMVDPASNSPTERTATPPSRSPSPALKSKFEQASRYIENNNIALDLAAKSGAILKRDVASLTDDEDYQLDVDQRSTIEDNDEHDALDAKAVSQVDVARKVRKFLDNQMEHGEVDNMMGPKLKRERTLSPCVRSESGYPLKKRAKFEHAVDSEDIESMTKSLILELSDRRGDHLTVDAIAEAASYTRCFLEMLLDDASIIARQEADNESSDGKQDDEESKREDQDLADSANGSASETSSKCKRLIGVIDSASMSSAFKMVPSKLSAVTCGPVNLHLIQ